MAPTQKEVKQAAKDIHAEAIEAVGGRKAWERLAYQARLDTLFLAVGKAVRRRWKPGEEEVYVEDIMLGAIALAQLDEDDL